MKPLISRIALLMAGIMLAALMGCAYSGQKFINLQFDKPLIPDRSGLVGIASFTDNRKGTGEGYVGHRILLDNTQETFFVQGLDAADSLTRVVHEYFRSCGFDTRDTSFVPTPENVRNAPADFEYLVAGKINKLECAAIKKPGRTEVVIDIDLTLMLGDKKDNSVRTIPVALQLERVEIKFDQYTVETLLNDALGDVLLKALPFDTL